MKTKTAKGVGIMLLFIAAFLRVFIGMDRVKAQEQEVEILLSNGEDPSVLKDGRYGTAVVFQAGDTITLKALQGSEFFGIYIIWDSPVSEWRLDTDKGSFICGENGFLHEYVKVEGGTKTAVIHILSENAAVSDIQVFYSEEMPNEIQVWQPPCKEADILLVPAHADDELLFFGGIIPTYGVEKNARIQVVYMSQFWSSERVREHEKLDGLWEAGLKYYPVSAGFGDMYSMSLEEAKKQYDEEAMVGFLVEQIRRFKPQIIVTHDFNGEYGHGYHRLTAKAVALAVAAAADASRYRDSLSEYGTWDTPKCYHHLYPENAIELELRVPIDSMGGRTALEIAADAYQKHVSQQWCWFYVSDDYEYSCARFGLSHTAVGTDSGNDMLENIKTYAEQESESMELESLRLAGEEAKRQEESRIRQSMEQSEAESLSIKESVSESVWQSREAESRQQVKRRENQKNTAAALILVAAALGITFFLVNRYILRNR